MPNEDTVEEKPTSVVFEHCKSVYEEMVQQAREEPIEGSPTPGATQLVYEGYLTKLVTGHLGLATPRYTAVMKHLKAMGCVEQLQRGGGNAPSRWRLNKFPNEETYRSIEAMNRPNVGKVAALEQQIRDINRRVQALEAERKFTLDTLQGIGAQLGIYIKLATDLKAQLHNHFGIHHDADQLSGVK